MQKRCFLSHKTNLEILQALAIIMATILVTMISTYSHSADNDSFAPAADFTPASCPSGHKMYYIGATPPTYSPMLSQSLSWTAGNTTKNFAFSETSGNKIFKITFSSIVDSNNSYGGAPPFYGSIDGATSSALNMVHNSPAVKTNHLLDISVDRPVSKMGYKIQDIDSTTSNSGTPYREQVDVSSSNGQLTFKTGFHTINTQKNIVTAIKGTNCGLGGCTLDATWSYNLANIALNLKHNNSFTDTNSPHAVGYSDFYFCLAPPKVIVKKQLSAARVNDTASNRDQFEISTKSSTTSISSFITTGSGQSIDTGSSGVLSLAENTSYTITERVTNSQNNGDIVNYNTAYTCTNTTTGSTTVMPTATMTYNAAAKTRSFTLANTTYGDEIICTITNSPLSYTFSGIVFDDNGGIPDNASTKQNISNTFTNNSNYFNGAYDSNEAGIYNSGLSIGLTDCNGTNIATTNNNPQIVSNTPATLGRYNFIVQPTVLVGKSKVCLIETEPSSWNYSVDTTTNEQEVLLVANTYNYKTEKNSSGVITRNLDFGEVQANNSALVLKKYQYVHDCNNALNYSSVSSDAVLPTDGFSINPVSAIVPGKCIAYKIDAYNRGHIDLADVQITDSLQLMPVKSTFQLPVSSGIIASLHKGAKVTTPTINIGENGTIISNSFNLGKTTNPAAPTVRTLFFNSKYGTTQAN